MDTLPVCEVRKISYSTFTIVDLNESGATRVIEHAADCGISSNDLARRIVQEALSKDQGTAKDDITCGVVYFRRPRRLLIVTGPPFSKVRDAELGELLLNFDGRKVICGGTTANIVSRQLNRPVRAMLERFDPEIPPPAEMEGIDLITEGTMTLARVAEMLDEPASQPSPDNPAHDLLKLMLASDVIEFVVGTRINEAHQDPNVPVELDLRRNIVRRIASALENKRLKRVSVRFI